MQPQNEAALQQLRILRAAKLGGRMWRNNSGCLPDAKGRPVRYGLGNSSAQVCAVCKSSDLIGITPVVIQPHHVGMTLGVFTAEEIKNPGWSLRPGDQRAQAQLNFINLVRSLGGIAGFITSEEQEL